MCGGDDPISSFNIAAAWWRCLRSARSRRMTGQGSWCCLMRARASGLHRRNRQFHFAANVYFLYTHGHRKTDQVFTLLMDASTARPHLRRRENAPRCAFLATSSRAASKNAPCNPPTSASSCSRCPTSTPYSHRRLLAFCKLSLPVAQTLSRFAGGSKARGTAHRPVPPVASWHARHVHAVRR